MKTCTKCKVEKDESEFSKNKNYKDGFEYRCKSCVREYRQSDTYKEWQKAYQQTGTYVAYTQSDARKEHLKAYRQTDAYKESQSVYRQTDAFKELRKVFNQTDTRKEYMRAFQKAYRLRKKAEAAALGKSAPSSDTQTIGVQE